MSAETESWHMFPCDMGCSKEYDARAHDRRCNAQSRPAVAQALAARDAEIGRLRAALKAMKDAAVYQCAAHARGGKKLLDEANCKLVDALSIGREALAGEKTDG